jgi:hypothetical protein
MSYPVMPNPNPCFFSVHPHTHVEDVLSEIQLMTGLSHPICLLDYRDGLYWMVPETMQVSELVNRTGSTSFLYDVLLQPPYWFAYH